VAVIGALTHAVVVPYLAANRHYGRAQRAMDDHDFLAAREHLGHCLRTWPNSAEINFLLARACRRSGDHPAAEQYLRRASEAGWASEQVDLEYLLIPAQRGDFGGDVEYTLRSFLDTRRHPEEPLIYEALAKGYLHTYRLFEAKELLDGWIERYPDKWQPRFWRGTVRERLGKAEFEAAQADYKRVLELRPQHAEAQLRLARVILGVGQDHQAAAGRFEDYLKVRPDDAEALNGLARCQRALGQFDAARTTLERLTAQDSGSFPGLVTLALLEADQENNEQALVHLRKAEQLGPNELEVVHHLGLVLRRLGQIAEADRYEQKFKDLEADLRELDKATKHVASNPRDAGARQTAGAILLRVGKEQEGLRWLQTALRTNPNHKPTHQTLADHYAKGTDAESRRLAELHRRRAQ
jgi:tetratricopeptide (TPR) repeat protein